MKIIKEGHSSYGYCWVEQDGCFYFVYVLDGRSKYGPFTTLGDALRKFSEFVA